MKKLFLTVLSLVIIAGSAEAAAFKLVANASVKLDSISKKEASDIFMKRTLRVGNGITVVPVDQTDRSGVRAEFSRIVHGKSTAAVKSYWNQQVFSGRDVPPVEKASDAEVLAFVRSTPGAVGYVSGEASADGVRVLDIQ